MRLRPCLHARLVLTSLADGDAAGRDRRLDESARVEDVLLEVQSVSQLLSCFVNAKHASFESILDVRPFHFLHSACNGWLSPLSALQPFHKLVRVSPALMLALCASGSLFRNLVERFSRVTKALVKINLLKITKTLVEAQTATAGVKRSGLHDTLERLGKLDDSVLVKKLAREVSEFVHLPSQSASCPRSLDVP